VRDGAPRDAERVLARSALEAFQRWNGALVRLEVGEPGVLSMEPATPKTRRRRGRPAGLKSFPGS
jgi:hypothetical protein